MNHCTNCGVRQGDYHLHGIYGAFEPQAPDEIKAVTLVEFLEHGEIWAAGASEENGTRVTDYWCEGVLPKWTDEDEERRARMADCM